MSENVKNAPEQETRKSPVIILSETNLMELNELFDKVIPPAYSKYIIGVLNRARKGEEDVPVQR